MKLREILNGVAAQQLGVLAQQTFVAFAAGGVKHRYQRPLGAKYLILSEFASPVGNVDVGGV